MLPHTRCRGNVERRGLIRVLLGWLVLRSVLGDDERFFIGEDVCDVIPALLLLLLVSFLQGFLEAVIIESGRFRVAVRRAARFLKARCRRLPSCRRHRAGRGLLLERRRQCLEHTYPGRWASPRPGPHCSACLPCPRVFDIGNIGAGCPVRGLGWPRVARHIAPSVGSAASSGRLSMAANARARQGIWRPSP